MAIFVNQGQNQGALFVNCRSNGYSDPRISITAESGAFKVVTPYNSGFVVDLKMLIPATARKRDAGAKAWYVGRDHADTLKSLIDQNYGGDCVLPNILAEKAEVFEITFQADYVANCKNEASSVHCNGNWNAKIPKKVLRKWFKQVDSNAPATLYGLLGIDKDAKPEEIKKAYKRAARTWHPDICKEPNAREMFEEIKEAFDVLNNPVQRNKYNAGLAFEAMAKTGRGSLFPTKFSSFSSFTPVLRCGILTVKAKREMGILIVEEILAWEDIQNEFGQIMVSFWAGDSFSIMWV